MTIEDTKGNPIVFVRAKNIKAKFLPSLLKDYLKMEAENEARLERLKYKMEKELTKSERKIKKKYLKQR